MPSVDLVDETFIVAEPAVLAAIVADPQRWAVWWPELELVIFMDRGLQGIRWTVVGELVGSCEIWLEAHSDGVLLHYYLRADLTEPGSRTVARQLPDSPHGHRQMAAIRRRHATRWKQHVWALKDELEANRPVGMPRAMR